eukprot:8600747-Karenia_brevis.AAC.1
MVKCQRESRMMRGKAVALSQIKEIKKVKGIEWFTSRLRIRYQEGLRSAGKMWRNIEAPLGALDVEP